MSRRRRTLPRFVVLGAALAAVAAVMVNPASAAIKPPSGAGTPVAGSGIGTAAALANPKCTHDDPRYGVYGRFNSTTVGGGPDLCEAVESR